VIAAPFASRIRVALDLHRGGVPSPVGEPKLEIRRGRASISLVGWGGCRCLMSFSRELGLGYAKKGRKNEGSRGCRGQE
jgi:hypothetical protein